MEDGGQAFPSVAGDYSRWGDAEEATMKAVPGMTLRDYFAGQALIALAGNWGDHAGVRPEDVADDCYTLADQMLVTRERNLASTAPETGERRSE